MLLRGRRPRTAVAFPPRSRAVLQLPLSAWFQVRGKWQRSQRSTHPSPTWFGFTARARSFWWHVTHSVSVGTNWPTSAPGWQRWHEVEKISFDWMLDPTDPHRLHHSDASVRRLAWSLADLMLKTVGVPAA